MQFATRKRRGTPTVIIVSLIDVLIVVLIFLMVTTTFKDKAALKVLLAKSTQAKPGALSNEKQVIIAIATNGVLSFKGDPVTFETLEKRLKEASTANPNLTVTIQADNDAHWGRVLQVREAAQAAHIKEVSVSVDRKKSE